MKSQVLPKGIPNCLKKRDLLNDKNLDPRLCREYGEKFLELGFWEDAVEFFLLGNDTAGLEKLRALAIEAGDAQLLSRLGPQDPEVWRQVAERALQAGKYAFAHKALIQAGDLERAEEVARLLRGGPA